VPENERCIICGNPIERGRRVPFKKRTYAPVCNTDYCISQWKINKAQEVAKGYNIGEGNTPPIQCLCCKKELPEHKELIFCFDCCMIVSEKGKQLFIYKQYLKPHLLPKKQNKKRKEFPEKNDSWNKKFKEKVHRKAQKTKAILKKIQKIKEEKERKKAERQAKKHRHRDPVPKRRLKRRHPLKPWKDPDSLFCSPNLGKIIGKDIATGEECRDNEEKIHMNQDEKDK